MLKKGRFGLRIVARAAGAQTLPILATALMLLGSSSAPAHDRQYDKKWIATPMDLLHFRGANWPAARAQRPSVLSDATFTSITVDYVTGSAWGFQYPNLIKFEKFGFRLHKTDVSAALTASACFLPPMIALASPAPQMVSDDLNGNLWMAVGAGVYRFTSSGEFQNAVQAAGGCEQGSPIVAMALNTKYSDLWVLRLDNTISILDVDGRELYQRTLAGGPLTHGADIEYDPALNEMWVALGDRVHAYGGANWVLGFSKLGTFSGQISPDGQGGVWAVSGAIRRANNNDAALTQLPVNDPGLLIHVARSGAVVQVEPFKPSAPSTCIAKGCSSPGGVSYNTEVILDLAADRFDASVWVLSAATLKNISKYGYETARYSSPRDVRDLSPVAPFLRLGFWADWEPPLFTRELPSSYTTYIRGDTTFRAAYQDYGLGFPSYYACPSNARITVAPATGLSVTAPVCNYQRKMTATLKPTGSDGIYKITATIDDAVGNQSVPLQFAVVVDRVAPSLTINSPANNAWARQSPVTINGYVDEFATLSANGSSRAAYTSFAFPIDIPSEGTYVIPLVARDQAGNSTTKNLTVRYDPTPPTVTITSPAVSGVWVASPTYAISGTLSESSTVTVNGASVGTLVAAFTTTRTLAVGANTFNIVATDLAGNATTKAVVVNHDPSPPVLDMARVNIGHAADGTVTIAGVAGSATSGTTVRVTNVRTGMTYTAAAAADGSFALSFPGETCDTLRIWLTKSSGSESLIYDTAVSRLQIIQPASDSTVQSEFVTVSGYFQAPSGSGIVVNGVTASAIPNGNRVDFTARVPLVVGMNTLAAVGTMPAGCVVNHQSTVIRSGTDPFAVNADPDSGVAPLGVTFTATSPSQTAITSVRFDFDGNGAWDATRNSAPFSATYTYSKAGLFKAKVGVTGSGVAERIYDVPISVSSTSTVDATARALWGGLKTALSQGNTPTALSYLQPEVRDFYAQIFAYDVRHVLGEITDIQPLWITGTRAEYAVLRVHNGIARSFVISFSIGADGVWRIESI